MLTQPPTVTPRLVKMLPTDHKVASQGCQSIVRKCECTVELDGALEGINGLGRPATSKLPLSLDVCLQGRQRGRGLVGDPGELERLILKLRQNAPSEPIGDVEDL